MLSPQVYLTQWSFGIRYGLMLYVFVFGVKRVNFADGARIFH